MRQPGNGARMECDAAARIFASHYQLVICDDWAAVPDEVNWRDGGVERGFAGNAQFRVVGTEADLNDHWVEVVRADAPPALGSWDRVTCVSLHCSTGRVHVMSVIDDEPRITLEVPKGDYSVYVAGCNMGVDQNSLGEDADLTDEELASRKDLEWYRIFIVRGVPEKVGRLKTETAGQAG